MSSRKSTIFCILLLCVGGAICLRSGYDEGWRRLAIESAAVAGGIIAFRLPGVRRSLERAEQKLSAWNPWLVGMFLGVIAFGYLSSTAIRQDRALFPFWHDHQMYLLQARMLSTGHLWMARHPLADFFEAQYVFVNPVYAAMYFPGTALMYVPAMWLGLPYWAAACMIASAAVGLCYVVFAMAFRPAAGLFATIMMLGNREFRFLSISVMSHPVFLVLMIGAVAAWLMWRRNHTISSALLLGACSGWAAITRPQDFVSCMVPLGVVTLIALLRMHRSGGWKSAACVLLAAAPFLGLQLAQNIGVGRNWHTSAMQRYVADEYPGLNAIGFQQGPHIQSATTKSQLLQKKVFFREMILKENATHTTGRLVQQMLGKIRVIVSVLPTVRLGLVLVPLSLLAVLDRRWWVLIAPLAGFILLYVFYPVVLPHYVVVLIPAMIAACLLGAEHLPGSSDFHASVLLGLVFAALVQLPETHLLPGDDTYKPRTMQLALETLPGLIQTPAIVMFEFAEGDDFHSEPVYNFDTANPDDAAIIKVHDLGASRDQELFNYYARRDPNRSVYHVRRSDFELKYLGRVGDLAGEQLKDRKN